MRARDGYRLIVRRGGLAPALLAAPDRIDHVEVVELDSGEVAFYWDLPPRRAAQLARAIRADLLALDTEEFRRRWSTVQQ